jgi:hypothetical protein
MLGMAMFTMVRSRSVRKSPSPKTARTAQGLAGDAAAFKVPSVL